MNEANLIDDTQPARGPAPTLSQAAAGTERGSEGVREWSEGVRVDLAGVGG